MTVIYGIKNCDTMKKAFGWLNDHGVDYTFHDYKKGGIDHDVIAQAIEEHGWDQVINRRGTTWRKLPNDIKDNMNDEIAMNIADDNPSILKRPLLLHDGKSYLGFKADIYTSLFVSEK